MKNIFSIKETSTHKIINCLGIRVKFRIKPVIIAQQENLLINQWITQHNNSFNAYIQQYTLVNKDVMSPLISLIAISTLLENNSFAQAEYILQKHVKKYGEAAIPSFLLVSAFCNKIGISTPEISKSAKIYEHIKSNQNSGLFNSLIQGKNIAIVGNSPCLLSKNKGCEIDSYDIVIKFNNFSNSPEYKMDYGEKNDIWMIAGSIVKPNFENHLNSLKCVLIADDIDHCFFSEKFRKFLYNIIINYSVPVTSFDFDFRKNLRGKYNLIHPSTGFQMVNYINSNRNKINKFKVFGFSVNDSYAGIKINMFNKFFETRKPFYIVHNYYKESEILSQILKDEEKQ